MLSRSQNLGSIPRQVFWGRFLGTTVLVLHIQWCQVVLPNQVVVTGFHHNAGKDLRFYLYGIRFSVLGFYFFGIRLIPVTGINIGTWIINLKLIPRAQNYCLPWHTAMTKQVMWPGEVHETKRIGLIWSIIFYLPTSLKSSAHPSLIAWCESSVLITQIATRF